MNPSPPDPPTPETNTGMIWTGRSHTNSNSWHAEMAIWWQVRDNISRMSGQIWCKWQTIEENSSSDSVLALPVLSHITYSMYSFLSADSQYTSFASHISNISVPLWTELKRRYKESFWQKRFLNFLPPFLSIILSYYLSLFIWVNKSRWALKPFQIAWFKKSLHAWYATPLENNCFVLLLGD